MQWFALLDVSVAAGAAQLFLCPHAGVLAFSQLKVVIPVLSPETRIIY